MSWYPIDEGGSSSGGSIDLGDYDIQGLKNVPDPLVANKFFKVNPTGDAIIYDDGGPKGDKGDTGDKGDQGVKGADGTDGTNGTNCTLPTNLVYLDTNQDVRGKKEFGGSSIASFGDMPNYSDADVPKGKVWLRVNSSADGLEFAALNATDVLFDQPALAVAGLDTLQLASGVSWSDYKKIVFHFKETSTSVDKYFSHRATGDLLSYLVSLGPNLTPDDILTVPRWLSLSTNIFLYNFLADSMSFTINTSGGLTIEMIKVVGVR